MLLLNILITFKNALMNTELLKSKLNIGFILVLVSLKQDGSIRVIL